MEPIMKRHLTIALAILSYALPAHAATPLTLDQALAIALQKHPQITEAKENLAGAEARAGRAAAGYYPQISLVADWSKGRTFLTALERVRSVEVAGTTLQLKQTVYDFGRTAGTVAAARSYREVADQGVALSRLDLGLRVRIAFYHLLAAEQLVIATADTVTAREAVHLQALEFFKQGLRAKVDLARAEADLFAAKTALIRAENGRELARVELANALGVASLGEFAPVEPAPLTAALPDRGLSHREALQNRAEMRQLAHLSSAAGAELKTAKAGYLPILSGTANYGYADRDFPPDGRVWGVGLNLTVPLFSGFSSAEEVREANAALNANAARQENLKLRIGKEVDSAWLGVNEAAARIISTDKQVTAAEENRMLAEGRYQEGVGNIIEVTDAQSLALEARTVRIQAQYDYYAALALLDRSMGRL